MKLALAQIDARLGDLDGIYERVEQQLGLAHEGGADLLCLPAPLLCGVIPGMLVEYDAFEGDLLRCLQRIARVACDLGIACLVPAILPFETGQLLEVFLLRSGRTVPLRLTMLRHHDALPVSPWSPPVFEVAGMRVAVTFDATRDLASVPNGCDLFVYFPINGFDMTNESTAAIAAVPDGAFHAEVEAARVWFACMEPIGGFDSAVYTGGSFIMDDRGRVVAHAPCFEEGLLIQQIRRDALVEALELHELPAYRREAWLWEALRLHLRDAVEAAAARRVLVPLGGDLPSSLLAVLAVDAVGPRNVLGLLVGHDDAPTPAREARECARAHAVRELASNLHIRLVERTVGSPELLVARDAPLGDDGRVRADIEALLIADTARELSAFPLTALTKTDCALRANILAGMCPGRLAPFGDIYLSVLEQMATSQARLSSVLPQLVRTKASATRFQMTLARDAASLLTADPALVARAAQRLLQIGLDHLDAALEAHVDRNASVGALALSAISTEEASLLAMLVRLNEAGRRMLPPAPIVSARGFSERLWPVQLAWSDMGAQGDGHPSADELAHAEFQRMERRGSDHAEQARGKLLAMLGELLGLTSDQQAELAGDAGQGPAREELREVPGDMRDLFRRMAGEAAADGAEESQVDAGPMHLAGPDFFSLN